MRAESPEPRLSHDLAGKRVSGTGHRPVADAPNGDLLYQLPQTTQAELDHAVDAAHREFFSWRETTALERSAILRRAAAYLREDRTETTAILVRETGRVRAQAAREVDTAAVILEQYAQLVSVDVGRALTRESTRVWGIELSEPAGVAGLITAWNVPLQLAAHKVGAALAAGCTAVLKPAPLAPASAHQLATALRRAGLPAGALSILHGDGEVGQMLVTHPLVRVVSFTGSDQSGRDVMAAAATGLKKVILELGGKNSNILFEDAPVDQAIPGIIAGFTRNQGAVCTAATRILVHRKLFDEVCDRTGQALEELRVGDPYVDRNDLGALRTPAFAATMDEAIESATGRGAHLVIGGTTVSVPGRGGVYRRPALLSARVTEPELNQRELMVPLAVISAFDDDDEALTLANDSQYGLAAGVWTADIGRAQHAWERLDVGTVYLNSYHRIDAIPLASGGRKSSGFGLEGGVRGIQEFTTVKSVHFPRAYL